ncbi:phage integrase [Salinisphaera shabanensis T35B1]|uniref:tyrosine-type recombinase/integrase n=1 Tax=Salinisphaera shabanensis TaxID=180542 RepID=UPI0033416C84
MARTALTKRYLDTVTGPMNGKAEQMLMDANTPGLGVRVRAGGAMTYCVVYKRHGRKRQMTLGGYHDLPLKKAREMAQTIRTQVAEGRDPAADKQRRLQAPTVRDVVNLFFSAEAVELRGSTLRNYRDYADRHILPALGTRKIEDVTRQDVSELRRAMADTPTKANRVVAFLSRLCTLAMNEDVLTVNPCARVKKYREEARERHLSDDEWKALTEALAADTNRDVANMVRLLMLTGARKSEVLRAEWSQFDLDDDRPVWVKPSSHTKQRRTHRVTLNRSAASLLRRIRSEAGGRSPYLFPMPSDPARHRADPKKPWYRIRKRAGLENVRMHDLRHTFASRAVLGGADLYVVGALLGHTQMRTTERYAHLVDEQTRRAANPVDDAPVGVACDYDTGRAANDG